MNTASIKSREQVVQRVLQLLEQAVGRDACEIRPDTTICSLGTDSLMLIQLCYRIQDEFGVAISFRLLLEELSTPARLTDRICSQLPLQYFEMTRREGQEHQTSGSASVNTPSEGTSRADRIQRIIALQLSLMEQQLLLIEGQSVDSESTRVRIRAGQNQALVSDSKAGLDRAVVRPHLNGNQGSVTTAPYVALAHSRNDTLNPQQSAYIVPLIQRLSKKTGRSKQLAQKHRAVLADSRATAGFHPILKELCYPLVVSRASGARIWDVDENEFVDLTMGFGALLFGHSPQFVIAAIQAEAEKGLQLGLQSCKSGEAAELLCELVGAERATFCNSGTEAIMGALRLARKATGREKIVMFSGSYHGTFDPVLARGEKAGASFRTVPAAPGVSQHLVDKVTVLNYGDPSSVDFLQKNGDEYAAILVEPVQSRRPDVQPAEFLRELRRIADEKGALLIFDEVVTGFRVHLGGIQALYNVSADLVTYGKAMGGGVPVGAIAGRAKYMDAIDGGFWMYGDESLPLAETTFLAGTYFKHPLVIAAVHATLSHLKTAGLALQESLNSRTAAMVSQMKQDLEALGVEIGIRHFGSLFRFVAPPDVRLWDAFYYGLLEKNVYVCETRNCFLSEAHSEQDINVVANAVREVAGDMKAADLLGSTSSTLKLSAEAAKTSSAPSLPASPNVKELPLTSAQAGLLAFALIGPEFCAAYNESIALQLAGGLNKRALISALTALVARHEALRSSFDFDGQCQTIAPVVEVTLQETDLFNCPQPQQTNLLNQILEAEATSLIALASPPLFRFHLVRLGTDTHVLSFTTHHLVIDGWSANILLDELAQLYQSVLTGRPHQLDTPCQISDYVQKHLDEQERPEFKEVERYWLDRLAVPIQLLDLPTDHPRPLLQNFQGRIESMGFSQSSTSQMRAFAAAHNCTLFAFLIAVTQVFLYRQTGQEDIVLGTHSAGQAEMARNPLVGFCVNMLPLRCKLDPGSTFSKHLQNTKHSVLEAYSHQGYSIGRLSKALQLKRDPARPPLISFVVNTDYLPNLDAVSAKMAGLKISIQNVPVVFSRFDMLWNFLVEDRTVSLRCTYSKSLFNVSTVREWLSEFVGLIGEVMSSPEQPLSEYSRQLQASGNATS